MEINTQHSDTVQRSNSSEEGQPRIFSFILLKHFYLRDIKQMTRLDEFLIVFFSSTRRQTFAIDNKFKYFDCRLMIIHPAWLSSFQKLRSEKMKLLMKMKMLIADADG